MMRVCPISTADLAAAVPQLLSADPSVVERVGALVEFPIYNELLSKIRHRNLTVRHSNSGCRYILITY